MHMLRADESHPRRKLFLHHFVADDQIGVKYRAFPLRDTAGLAPRQERGIFLDLRHQIEKLFTAIGQRTFFGVGGHYSITQETLATDPVYSHLCLRLNIFSATCPAILNEKRRQAGLNSEK